MTIQHSFDDGQATRAALPRPAPAACPQPLHTEQQTSICAGFDARNAALNAQIATLEEKLTIVKTALEAGARAAPAVTRASGMSARASGSAAE